MRTISILSLSFSGLMLGACVTGTGPNDSFDPFADLFYTPPKPVYVNRHLSHDQRRLEEERRALRFEQENLRREAYYTQQQLRNSREAADRQARELRAQQDAMLRHQREMSRPLPPPPPVHVAPPPPKPEMRDASTQTGPHQGGEKIIMPSAKSFQSAAEPLKTP